MTKRAKQWKLKSKWWRDTSKAKQSWRNIELVGEVRVNTDVHLKADRNLVLQACRWAAWKAERDGLLQYPVGSYTAKIGQTGVLLQSKLHGICIALPDWPDLEETAVNEEMLIAA